MANPEHVEIVKQGAEAIREWQEKHPNERLSLWEANLGEANLERANLGGAQLERASLREAKLQNAFCAYTTFANLDLSEAIGLNRSNMQVPARLAWTRSTNPRAKFPKCSYGAVAFQTPL